MEGPLLTSEECSVDACVLGTGLTESLVAAALARHGKRVLHLDHESSYGGSWRALSLVDLEAWAAITDGGTSNNVDEPVAVEVETREQNTDGSDGGNDGGGEDHTLMPKVAAISSSLPSGIDISGLTAIPMAQDLFGSSSSSCFSDRKLSWDPYGAKTAAELEALRSELRKKSNTFSVDLAPRLLFGRSDLVDVLVESGVSRYLEFQGLKSARVLSSHGLVSVPLTKSDIFQDPVLSLPEKRALMRFITSMTPFVGSLAFESPAQLGVDRVHKVPGPNENASSGLEGVDLEQPWAAFLEQQKLSPRLREFLTYAICLWDWTLPSSQNQKQEGTASTQEQSLRNLSTRQGLSCLGRFVSSLGMHGKGSSMPLLYPMYGAAEMAQGFTRMCALHGGTYALRTKMTHLLAEREQTQEKGSADKGSAQNREGEAGTGNDERNWRVAGLVTHRGEVVRASTIISSCDHLLRRASDDPKQNEKTQARVVCKRMTVLVDCPLLEEEGLHLCVVPPGAVEPALDNVVQVLQLDWSTGTCPKGYHVVHLSQAAVSSCAETGNDTFNDLERALLALLELAGGERHCLLRCTYQHLPRPLSSRWDASASEGGADVLAACARGSSLMVSADPAAAPQLLAMAEVPEARELFLRAPLHGTEAPAATDFLLKPAHVVQEEQSTAMEDLEHFNEQMAKTSGEPDVRLPSAFTEADSGVQANSEEPADDTCALQEPSDDTHTAQEPSDDIHTAQDKP
eukprot:CAMPEP_0172840232 /NCGR_PEP_ID=MMETSP1075-20121228/29153_1 /TAXON_ID=2916 /ORGANISM="Ceratium fusus, Strain PA161109" /LENGTH=740 /DNA_ID=CAMNT_0013684019 /DNA_START=45 /DNA_END=2270 /DNA_ORIENTATION=+